jgi:plastocyanin
VARIGIACALVGAALVAGIARAGETVVVQKNKTFIPSAVTIKPGDTLIFRNEDGVDHNAFSDSKDLKFNLKSQAPGASDSVTFVNEGTAEVRCAFHPAMKLKITVAK